MNEHRRNRERLHRVIVGTLFLFLLTAGVVWAVVGRVNSARSTPNRIWFDPEVAITVVDPDDLLREFGFGNMLDSGELRRVSEYHTIGGTTIRYRQYYSGLPVVGGSVVVRISDDRRPMSLFSSVALWERSATVRFNVSNSEAISIARRTLSLLCHSRSTPRHSGSTSRHSGKSQNPEYPQISQILSLNSLNRETFSPSMQWRNKNWKGIAFCDIPPLTPPLQVGGKKMQNPLQIEEEAMQHPLKVGGEYELSLRGEISAERVVLPRLGEPVFCWCVTIPASHPLGDWEMMIRGDNGDVLLIEDCL
ncbi:MAG: hypothetical protein P9M15_00650, partial [Candidatus Electryoneaceae bacterium]|nr:hypothetical protein [Candidatus Electryoneaceae bacterium]